MKKFLLFLLTGLLLATSAIAAGPTVEESQYMQFTVADQESTNSFNIYSIVWTEDDAANKDIASDDDLTIEDGAGVVIFSKRAAAAGDGIVVPLTFPITVSGIKAEDLDGGILYIYGQRR
jgi:hypothetical protein